MAPHSECRRSRLATFGAARLPRSRFAIARIRTSLLKTLALGFVALGASFLAPGARAASEPLERQIVAARLKAIADGDVLGAIALLEPIVAKSNGALKAEAADELGTDLDALGRTNQARAAFQAALAANPEDTRAARHLALLDGFDPVWGAPVSVHPTLQPPISATLAPIPGTAAGWEALLPEESRAAFAAQIEAYTRRRAAEVLFAEGQRLWAKGEADKGFALMDELVTQFPAELKPADLLGIGDRAMRSGHLNLAAAAFRQTAQREDPDHAPWANFELGEALMRASDMKGARAAFEHVLRAGAAARSPQGGSLAIPAEERVRETRGLPTWSAYLAVQKLFQEGETAQYAHHDPATAEQIFWRVVNEFPQSNFDGRALDQLAAIAYYQRDHATAALQALEEVMSDDRKNDLWPDGVRAGAWALFHEGRIREAIGDKAGARQAYHRLLAEYPGAKDHDGKPFAAKAQARLAALGFKS